MTYDVKALKNYIREKTTQGLSMTQIAMSLGMDKKELDKLLANAFVKEAVTGSDISQATEKVPEPAKDEEPKATKPETPMKEKHKKASGVPAWAEAPATDISHADES